MPTIYEIDFTDLNLNRTFQISPYTSNGPASPSGDTLAAAATAANTSLLLTGKGFPNYGEIVAENFTHLLENFSNATEPSYPISGQIWYDTSGTWEDAAPSGSPPDSGFVGVPVPRLYNANKHLIIANHPTTPNNGLLSTITMDGNYLTRFPNGKRIRLFDVTGSYVEYIISAAPALDINDNTYFSITPTPGASAVGSWVGGWDRITTENSNFLSQNMSGKDYVQGISFRITDLADPIDDQDAVTKKYFENNATTTLDGLTDTTITAPALNELLVYDAGQWVNKDATSAGVLPLTGGTLTGPLYLPLVAPTLPQQATTKDYVDALLGGGVGQLDDLADVTITGPIPTFSLLYYNGFQWVNDDLPTYAGFTGLMLESGATMTGDLLLNYDVTPGGSPLLPSTAASIGYVDSVAGGGDGVVIGGFFDAGTQLLQLTLTAEAPFPVLQLTGWDGMISGTNQVVHEVQPVEPYNRGGYLEHPASYENTYPDVTVEQIFRNVQVDLGHLSKPRDRAVFDADGNALVDTEVTYGDLQFAYVPGYSSLRVYEDGLKRIASEHGWLRVAADLIAGSPEPDVEDLWPGFPTGLLPGQLYSFDIELNQGNASSTGTLTVVVNGSACQTLGALVRQMIQWSDINLDNFGGSSSYSIPPFGVQMYDGVMVFYSSFPGSESNVHLTDGTPVASPSVLPLFANIVGGTGYTYTINPATLDTGERNDGTGSNAPAPLTRHYREVGRVGMASTIFEWEAGWVPAGSPTSEIEIISDLDLLYDPISTAPTP